MGVVDMSEKGKKRFIKNNMLRDDDAIRPKLETPISLVFRRVAKEVAQRRARGEFVGCCGGHIGIASTPKNTEVGVRGLRGMKGSVWCREGEGFSG
jgi:hypothetical protein